MPDSGPMGGGFSPPPPPTGNASISVFGNEWKPPPPPKPMAEAENYWSKFFREQYDKQRPGIAADTQAQDEARKQQELFLQQLHRLSQGDPNSLAQQALARSTQTAQGQLGGALAARGNLGGAGAAMRQAQAGQQAIGAAGVDASGLLMQQERAAAQQALAQALAAQRQQDIGQAGTMADISQRDMALNDALRQFYFGQGIKTNIGLQQIGNESALANLGLNLEFGNLNKQYADMLRGALATGAGKGVSMFGGSSGGGGGGGNSGGGLSAPPLVPASTPDEWSNPFGGG